MIAITKQITKNKLANTELSAKILQLKNEKNAVLLAHYYQEPEIQELADFVGDSLELSRQAASTNAKIIIFAGVHFMAETAKIINPNKTVIVPDLKASCSLAESCPPKEFKAFIDAHPGHTVITYINCSAEIKALSDLVCTSSNAEKIINSVPKNQPIIFAPDYNLGRYMIKKTGRDMVLWQGACIVHEAFSIDKILKLHKKHPQAEFIAHPESESQVLEIATYIGSTSGLIKYVKESQSQEFIVATEAGILYKMQMEVPDKLLIPAPANEDNTCACSECAFMKMNTLEKLYQCLKNEAPVVDVAEAIRKKALIPINRMLELSK
ncbi:MAG: quinolinate synthase [Flavobacteriales bacterium CG03_land_8_20_14_0_80_35_15]|nr:MAG: quinolinate synthase [Flavobacteriales bacterium CG03_land_8_20_14_0_80_35_15]PIX06389.1 MAG: quinolinate synthase [Flavobacteriales bacterium CG_4_8_14_3_um_filter_35_10]